MRNVKSFRVLCAIFLPLACLGFFGSREQATGRTSAAKSEPPSTEKVLQFVREKFGVVSTTKLTLGSFDPSPDPDYYQTSVKIDDGKQSKDQALSVSKNGRYLLVGDLLPLGSDFEADITRQVRDSFKVPANVTLTAGPLHPSKTPGFLITTVVASDGAHPSQKQDFFVTTDKKFLNFGGAFLLNQDPRREALTMMSLKDQPSQGPANAPVTIVEFADLECPSCAHMQEYLENDLLPKYKDKVRVIFKEFPLPMHPWGATGAIANECAFEIDPSKFAPYRTLIFKHQSDVDAVQADSSQVRELLLSYGQQVGLDRGKLAACFDSQASKPRVEAGRHEGDALNVSQTPTFFINGKVLPGAAPPDVFTQAVEDALKGTK